MLFGRFLALVVFAIDVDCLTLWFNSGKKRGGVDTPEVEAHVPRPLRGNGEWLAQVPFFVKHVIDHVARSCDTSSVKHGKNVGGEGRFGFFVFFFGKVRVGGGVGLHHNRIHLCGVRVVNLRPICHCQGFCLTVLYRWTDDFRDQPVNRIQGCGDKESPAIQKQATADSAVSVNREFVLPGFVQNGGFSGSRL